MLRALRALHAPTLRPKYAVRMPVRNGRWSAPTCLLTTSAVLAKKKKGGNDKAPPADVAPQLDLDAMEKTMNSAFQRCSENVQSIIGSLGRVDASLLDPVRVTLGKNSKPVFLDQVATVGVRDGMLIVTAYDESSVKHIERAIYSAKLDLTPRVAQDEEGVVLVPVPKPTGETRTLLVQKCVQACEHARVALRNARQTAQKQMKHDLDNKVVSKSEAQKESKKLEEISKQHKLAVDRLASELQKRLQH
ncbi:hypothetical protein MVES1_002901 [Malassezia vespertilionis]|uniref:Ribosome recycling factor domain-containing protein n=1 Tax=Malassezia vespertilionis TaxID=2020962 RepID=A0A2N1J966_9BASI|nr:uncharacterized protein MVES1_002901 [Malassezia vespertilionis]PKI83074.1 hypothetical protein MVES_002751 [Malassezia vespertilionis]WFD07535.1 hypothetical protein MVES1_002901 [Malassezia vespertilionis]